MADETKQYDPSNTEIPVDFFENQKREEEDEFINSFDERTYEEANSPRMTDEVEEVVDPQDANDEEDPAEPFKFDDTLAEAEKAELAELNAKLGTNFEDLKELKEKIKQTDTKEQISEIEEDRDFVAYFQSVMKYDDKDIVMEDEKLKAQQLGKNIKDPRIMEEIEEKVERLEQNEMLDYAAQAVRNNVQNAIDKRQSKIDAFENSQKQTLEQKEAARKEQLQESINSIYKAGKFLNITPKKEDFVEIYRDLSKGKLIDHLNADPASAVEVALYLKYKNEISKNLGKPGFKAGVKSALETIGMTTTQQTGKGVTKNDRSDNQDELSYLDAFAK